MSTVLLALAAAHVALKLALLPIAVGTRLQGDENAYNLAARTFADAVRSVTSGNGLPLAQLGSNVIAQGWFMPGMSLLLTPVYLVTPTPSVAAVRLYVGLITTVLLLLGAALVNRWFGTRYAAAVLVFPGLVPVWVLFSYTAWGDLTAGLAVLVLVGVLGRLWQRLGGGSGLRIRDGALVGLLLASILYLRSSTLPLVMLVLLLGVLAVVRGARGATLRRSLTSCVAALVVFVALLAPWSIAASRHFEHRVITTTTVPISMAYAFGNRDELCFGPCPPGNVWSAMVRYSRQEAARTGESELAVQQRMADHAMRDVTAEGYAKDVLDNFGRYVLAPARYEAIFRVPLDSVDQRPEPPGLASTVIVWSTLLLYFPVLILAVAGILLVRRVPAASQLVGLLAAALGGALMSQPFVHVASPRYWPVFAPLMALSAATLLAYPDRARSSGGLRLLQLAAAVGWVVVIGGLFVVAGIG